MNIDIWFQIGVRLDYESLSSFFTVNESLSQFKTNNFFWIEKSRYDFPNYSHQSGDRETYLYLSGINEIPNRGAERYGNIKKLIRSAIKTNNNKLIRYFCKLYLDGEIFIWLGKANNHEIIKEFNYIYLYETIKGAIKGKHSFLIKELFSPKMPELSRHEQTHLFITAAYTGDVCIFKYLNTIYDTDFDAGDDEAISFASGESGNLDMVNHIIDIGIREYDSVLCGAAKAGHKSIIEKMLHLGAKDIKEAKEFLAEGGHFSLLAEMPNSDLVNFHTSLFRAAFKSPIEVIKTLVELEANVDGLILQAACIGNSLDVVQFLISKFSGFGGDFPQYAFNALHNHVTIFYDIIKYVDKKYYHQLLIRAANQGNLLAFTHLLELGASPLTKNVILQEMYDYHLNILIELVNQGIDYKIFKGQIPPQLYDYLIDHIPNPII